MKAWLPGAGRTMPWPVMAGLFCGVVTVAYPVLMLFLQSVFPDFSRLGVTGAFTPFQQMAGEKGLGSMWGNSLAVASLTTLLAWALGIPAGWLLARLDLPGKAFIRISLLLPVMSPPYLLAIAYVLMMQRNGLIENWMGPMPAWLQAGFFDLGGVVFVMAMTSFGLVALLVEAALGSISTRHEDAARCLGASRWAVFRRVTLPLLVPALVNSGVLVFVDALSNFGIAAILGPRSDLVLLPTVIYELLTSWPVDLPLAAAISSILAVTSIVLVSLAKWLIGVKIILNGRVVVTQLLKTGFWHKVLAFAFFGALFAMSSLLPNSAILLMSFVETWQGGAPLFTLAHYGAILAFDSTGMRALSTSGLLSFVAASICVIIGAIIAYAVARYRGTGVVILDYLSMIPRVLPNLVIAVALILAWNVAWVPVPVYGTLAILVLAYIATYQAIGLRFADAAISQIAVRMESAASCLGASRFAVLRRIVVPMMLPALFVAWISIFIMCLRDWVASIMLLPPGATTVGSFIYSEFEQGAFSRAMAMSVCTVLLSSILLVLANLKFYRRALL